jgi:hypothetical protein
MRLHFAKLLILPLFLSLPLHGQTDQCAKLKNGETLRLDQPQKSLANFKVQDQDGFGSCYANTASVMAQSTTKGHPNISYIQMALTYQESANKKSNSPSAAIEGGFTCEAYNLALENQKKGRKICDESSLEIQNSRDPESSVHAAAKYLINTEEHFSGIFAKSRSTRQTIVDLLKTDIGAQAAKECSSPSKRAKHLNYRSVAEELAMQLHENNPRCLSPESDIGNQKICSQLYRLYAGSTRASSKKYLTFTSFSLPSELTKQIDQDFKSQMKNLKNVESYKKFIADSFAKFTNDHSNSDFAKEIEKILSKKSRRLENMIESDISMLGSGRNENCEVRFLIEILKNQPKEITSRICTNCEWSDAEHEIKDLGAALDPSQIKNINSIFDFLIQGPGRELDDAALMLFGAHCPSNSKIEMPANVTCETSQNLINPAAVRTKNEDYLRYISNVRNRFYNSISDGKAAGIGFCTKFLIDPNYSLKSYDDQRTVIDSCANMGRHGIHAMAIIGLRCKNGKTEYLAQNSWGPYWQPPGKNFEVENGKIWLSEDQMFQNTLDFNFLVPSN